MVTFSISAQLETAVLNLRKAKFIKPNKYSDDDKAMINELKKLIEYFDKNANGKN